MAGQESDSRCLPCADKEAQRVWLARVADWLCHWYCASCTEKDKTAAATSHTPYVGPATHLGADASFAWGEAEHVSPSTA